MQKIEKALSKALQEKILGIENLHDYLEEKSKSIQPVAIADAPSCQKNSSHNPTIAPTQLSRYNDLTQGGKSA